MMRVGELIRRLRECDVNDIAMLSLDEEMNECGDIGFINTGLAIDDDGTIGLANVGPDEREIGFTEDDVVVGESIIVISP